MRSARADLRSQARQTADERNRLTEGEAQAQQESNAATRVWQETLLQASRDRESAADLDRNVERLQQADTNLAAQLSGEQAELDSAKQDWNRLVAAADPIASQMTALAQDMTALNVELTSLQAQSQDPSVQHDPEKLKAIREQIAQVQQAVAGDQTRYDELNRQIMPIADEQNAVTARIQSLNQAIARDQSSLGDIHAQIADLGRQRAELQARIDAEERDARVQEARATSLQNFTDEYARQVVRLEQEFESLQTEIGSLDQQISELCG